MDKKIYWVIADVHGAFDKLKATIANMTINGGFDLNDPNQMLIQLGDRVDRGSFSYEVNEFFKSLQEKHPDQVIILNGNHDKMMLDAADDVSDLFYYNGGNSTLLSYGKRSGRLEKHNLKYNMEEVGHYEWLKKLPLYYETPDYFFCHAPIPRELYRGLPIDADFRTDEGTLTWSYVNDQPEDVWVDGSLIPKDNGNDFKLTCYGHIHSGKYDPDLKDYVTPNPRLIGNAALLDTGAGCWKTAELVALRLPDMMIFSSEGKKYKL